MAGFFSPAALEQVRAASDIVEVIGSYLPLKRAGANFVALCPFHKEKSPSFNVSPRLQTFHCFGCHKGGDVFKFVQEYESLPFPDAVRRLAERAKIPLETSDTPGDRAARHIKDTLLEIHEHITRRWQAALANDAAGQIARDYLARRGLSVEAVQLFRLGYAPDQWDDTVNWAKSKGYPPELMEQAGLILRRDNGGYYDRFRGRLMFPICDEPGRVIGFSGRVLSGDEKTAKYVNSPETPLFHKSRVFFGLDKSKRDLIEAGHAIICEGQVDLITCFTAGVRNIVAPQGTAFTPDHARILKRYVNEVVLCFDSDNAGQNAAVRALDCLLAAELTVRVATVPAPHDPDSFIRAHGAAAFQTLIQQAPSFFDFYLERLCGTNDVATDKGQLAVLRGMAEAMHKADNAVLQDRYARKTAIRLGVDYRAAVEEFRKFRGKPVRPEPAEELAEDSTPASRFATVSKADQHLLKLLLESDEHLAWAAENLDPAWLPQPDFRALVGDLIATFRAGDWHGLGPYLSRHDDPALQDFLTGVSMADFVGDHQRGRALPKPLDDLKGYVEQAQAGFIAQEVRRLVAKADRESLTDEEARRLLELRRVASNKRLRKL